MIERTKKDCKLLGTEICAYAGCEGCEKCFVSDRAYKKADMEEINESWKITLSYLPENVDELHTSDKCWLCKGERRDASCFACFSGLGKRCARRSARCFLCPSPAAANAGIVSA